MGTTARPQVHSLARGRPHGERDKPRWMEVECGLGRNLLEAADPLSAKVSLCLKRVV